MMAWLLAARRLVLFRLNTCKTCTWNAHIRQEALHTTTVVVYPYYCCVKQREENRISILTNATHRNLVERNGTECLWARGDETWKMDYLRSQDKQSVPIKSKNIFFHGLPEMGPIWEAKHLTSNPSISTEEQHAKARLKISTFLVLSDLKVPDPDTKTPRHRLQSFPLLRVEWILSEPYKRLTTLVTR